MSNTYRHKDKGKFHNKVLNYNEVCESTKNMWDRHNSEYGEDKERQLQIKEKIAEKELKTEIKEIIEQGVDFDIPEQDKIIEQIFGKQ